MDITEKLIQIFSGVKIHEIIKELSELSVSLKEILLFAIYIISIIGFCFWYIHKKYRNRYIFEKSSSPEFLSDLINRGIEGLGESTKLIKLHTKSIISITAIIAVIIAYYFFGIKGMLIIIFLDAIALLKLNITHLQNSMKEGRKNNNYISLYIRIYSLEKSLIWLFETIFSKKIILLISYTLITIFLIQNELFYYWASFWIIFYLSRLIYLSYVEKLMANPPLFVTVEYTSGDKDEHLILYQTTSTDYRFKQHDTEEELIIPASSIKKIYFGYGFELSELDKLTSIEALRIDLPIFHKHNMQSAVSKIFDTLFKPSFVALRAKSWYRKAVIYSKIKDFENAQKSIKQAITLDKKYKYIAKNDRSFDNIQNEEWFMEIINT